MWITLSLRNDTSRVDLFVAWDDAVIDGVGALGSSLADDGASTVRRLRKLAKANRSGVPGYATYCAYLTRWQLRSPLRSRQP